MNINNITLWMDRNAFFPWTIGASGTAGEYPKGTGGLIFAEGMLWGVKADDGLLPVLRVNGSTYANGLKAGKCSMMGVARSLALKISRSGTSGASGPITQQLT